MTALTPIYGLKYIVEGEPLRNARAALEDNAKTIEAALQAGGVAATGASDLLALSGRVSVLESTAWTPLAGAPAFGGLYQTPQYRKLGDRVELRGLVSASPATNAVFATLPTGFRPPNGLLFPSIGAGTWIDVFSDGRISRSGTGIIPLDGIRFSTRA